MYFRSIIPSLFIDKHSNDQWAPAYLADTTYVGNNALEENRYWVSDLGAVYDSNKGKILTPYTHKSGQLYINVVRDDERRTNTSLATLVLVSFQGQPGEPGHRNPRISYKDGDSTNVALDNLTWYVNKYPKKSKEA